MAKLPCVSVVAVREIPFEESERVMVALATAAPLGSATQPVMDDEPACCAAADDTRDKATMTTSVVRKDLLFNLALPHYLTSPHALLRSHELLKDSEGLTQRQQ